jgi:signal transduction histidine kinase
MQEHLSIIRDPKRLAALHRLMLLDTPQEESFDRLTRLAARLFNVPLALVTLADAERLFFKSFCGLGEPWASRREMPLTDSFCQHTISSKQPLVLEDIHHYPQFSGLAAVSALNIRAYAGVPLVTREGYEIGSFCLIQSEPRLWSDEDMTLLDDLAQSVMSEIELRSEIRLRREMDEALEHQLDLLTTLHSINAELTHQLDTAYVVSIGLDAVLRLSRAECGYIALYEEDQLELKQMIGAYDEASLRSFLHNPPPGSLLARVLLSRLPVWVEDASREHGYVPFILETRSLLLLPLVSTDRTLGIFCVETRHPDRFTSDILDFVLLLASRLAAAIDNARLYEVAQARLDELHKKNAQLQELEALKTQIIRIAAHDLRNPLGAVSGYIELIRENMHAFLSDDAVYFLSMIESSIQRMRHITDEILSIQRIETMLNEGLMPVDLKAVIQRALRDLDDKWQREAQQLSAHLPPQSVIVYAEESYLGEAVTNLLTNAVKYTPRGGRIDVRLKLLPDHVMLEIEDTGIGVPVEAQKRLFQPFYRVRMRETSAIDGTGLGLYLVKQIVERCGGEVVFQSVYGKGSTFGFRLPLAQINGGADGGRVRPRPDSPSPAGSATV